MRMHSPLCNYAEPHNYAERLLTRSATHSPFFNCCHLSTHFTLHFCHPPLCNCCRALCALLSSLPPLISHFTHFTLISHSISHFISVTSSVLHCSCSFKHATMSLVAEPPPHPPPNSSSSPMDLNMHQLIKCLAAAFASAHRAGELPSRHINLQVRACVLVNCLHAWAQTFSRCTCLRTPCWRAAIKTHQPTCMCVGVLVCVCVCMQVSLSVCSLH